MADIDWKEELVFEQEDVHEIHGHKLGLKFYRGYDANKPDSPKTIRIVVLERDLHDKVKPYRVKDWETQKAKNLQIILPDDLAFAKIFGQFVVNAVKNAGDMAKAEAKRLQEEAEKASA